MDWVTQEQCASLLRFLDVYPLLNNHEKLKIKHFSFYSSELKNLKQTVSLLEITKKNSWANYTTSDDKTKIRYANSLQNMGLLIESDSDLILSDTANQVLKYINDKGLTSDDLVDKAYSSDAVEVERIILENLLFTLKKSDDADGRVYKFASEIFFRLQDFYESCDHLDIDKIANDERLLYFCQIINSSGFELKKFFSIADEDERLELKELWYNLAEDKNYPNTEPTNPFERAIYIYTRPLAKKTLQYDLRFRCRNIISAYLLLKKEYDMPEISSEFIVLRKNPVVQKKPLLTPLTRRDELRLPHQLIATGCPGSGKSTYLDVAANQDKTSQIIRISAHPEYSYSDLIGCYKPVPIYQKVDNVFSANGEKFEKGLPRINYEFVIGPLVKQLIQAIQNPTYNFILIIEEINRTNANALFGDFFQLLDRKQGKSELQIEAMPDLAAVLIEHNLPTEIRLPSNFYIWATMNAADQGVFSLDSAFRRRWEFIYRGYNEECKYPAGSRDVTYGGQQYDWDVFRGKINTKLLDLGVHEDKMIGPYFLKMDELTDPRKICNKLFLYLWEDVLRFQRNDLMKFKSFADLTSSWNNGIGSPLEIDLNN